jgi:signal recognition particle receptor subunit beta
MSTVNYGAREITCKLVYYGPGLCGKTTNVEVIYNRSNPANRGKLISLTTESERTLFFDFFPLSLGKLRDFDVRFHIYTVPGQVFYQASRKVIVRGTDGLVFVADSQRARLEANAESIEDMHECLGENGVLVAELPMVLQCNKQDVHDALEVGELQRELGLEHVPAIGATAAQGIGVFETLQMLGKRVLARIAEQARM